MSRNFGGLAARTSIAAVALALQMGCAPRHSARYQMIYVDREPPASRVEIVSERPGGEFAWVPGYWRWERNDYVWAPGHWEHAPRARALWVPGRWRHDRRGWYFTPGHWR